MKALKRILTVWALLVFAPFASGSTYVGTWKNKTFGSTGGLTITFKIQGLKVVGSFDFDGPVFGGGDPPAVNFSAPFDVTGKGTFKVKDTDIGDVAGSFNARGRLTIRITNIPGGFLDEGRVDGKFDLGIESFTATYEVDANGSLFANGVANAHVPKAPVIKAPGNVSVTGTTGDVQAKVITNTNIKSFKATADHGANVAVSGNNPYLVEVANLTAPTTNVVLTVKNADGFSTSKTVKFNKGGTLPRGLLRGR